MAGGRYSAFVRVLRIGLPLTAIALMSTIFLVSNDADFDGFEDVLGDITQGVLLNEGVMSPRFSGLNHNGLSFSIQAGSATANERGGSVFTITDLSIEAVSDHGLVTYLSASSGTYDTRLSALDADTPVVIRRSNGADFRADSGYFNFAEGRGRFEGNVILRSPGVDLAAGWMELTEKDIPGLSRSASDLYIFGGGVKLRVDPSLFSAETGEGE